MSELVSYKLPAKDLREQIERIERNDELCVINAEVDAHLEIAEIHRRVIAEKGPALLFTNVKGSQFPVVTNLYGTEKRTLLSFGTELPSILDRLVTLLHNPPTLPSIAQTVWKNKDLASRFLSLGRRFKSSRKSRICENQIDPVDLEKLPIITSWPEDGGAFITLPLVLTRYPKQLPQSGGKGENLGMYRIQRFNKNETGLHFQIQKGGGFHLHEAHKNELPLDVAIFVGGSPALTLSAIAPLPENISEVLLCSFLQAAPVLSTKTDTLPLFESAEFALLGKSPPRVLREEGPFGDHYGFYSLKHPFPLFQCQKLYHRNKAIWPATVVGKYPQEDFYLGNILQEMLSPLIPLAMPGVEKLHSYGESGFHALAGAVVKERYSRELQKHALRILGEGQLSLTKTLLITDAAVDPKNFLEIFTAVLERIHFGKDLTILAKLSLDTLDYTGPKLNHGSRAILAGSGAPIRRLRSQLPSLPRFISDAMVFTPGCALLTLNKELASCFDREVLKEPLAMISASMMEIDKKDPQPRSPHPRNPQPAEFPICVIVDDLSAGKSVEEFLWAVFMRFDPAQDIFFASSSIAHHHICYQGSLVIDARQKPSYPDVLECDPKTKELVDRRWKEYFN